MAQVQSAPELADGTAAGPGLTAGGSVPNAGLTVFTAPNRVHLAKFTIPYGSAPANPFAKHIPMGGDIVIAQFGDPVVHVYLLAPGGLTDTII